MRDGVAAEVEGRGRRQVCVVVIFTDEHPEVKNGLPVALVRGCTVARGHAELARLTLGPGEPNLAGVRLYVEPDTTDAEMCLLWMAGFRVRIVRVADVLPVPSW